MLRARYSPYAFVAVILLVGLYVLLFSGVAWQTRVSGQQPAIRLTLHRDVSKLILVSEDEGQALHFAVAENLTGVRNFWLAAPVTGDKAPASQLWQKCQEVSGSKTATQEPVKSLSCELEQEDIDRSGQARPSRLQKFLPKSTFRKVVLRLPPPSTSSMYQEFWLIPYVQSAVTQTKTVSTPVPEILWTEARWQMGETASGGVAAKRCSNPDGGLEAPCLFVQGLLDRPELVLIRDPQQIAIAVAQRMSLRIVPFLVGVMVCANFILAVVFIGLLFWWFSGLFRSGKGPRLQTVFDESVPPEAHAAGQSPPSLEKKPGSVGKIPLLFPLQSVERSFRGLLEWLEVTGPALGFLLTVCALLLAFDPRIFVERDMNRFSSAISMAMSATFAGLGIRIFAFSCDRLLEHVLRRGGDSFRVDLTDTVYQVPDKRRNVTSLSPSPEQVIEPAPAQVRGDVA
ncbi:hypothetical protein Q664_27245 [Archangium violaceum Cb vi76]|uniref:Uncharacterized protein n=1 Tax=Archangium violaceum Cb vi76 TaxID=1406225 RepID=A0A084SQ29_9BACT|nr:hypothetical protein Q664_27245 [Archangium violaceum Cb vi76]